MKPSVYFAREENAVNFEPAPRWKWYVFGDLNPSIMTVDIWWDVPWWRRALTSVLLGSKWTRIGGKP